MSREHWLEIFTVKEGSSRHEGSQVKLWHLFSNIGIVTLSNTIGGFLERNSGYCKEGARYTCDSRNERSGIVF